MNYGKQARGLAILGAVMMGVTSVLNQDGFWQAYLLGYLFWGGIALGSLGLLLLYHVTGGRWGRAVLPILSSAAETLPWWGLMLLPVFFELHRMYPWSIPELAAADPLLQHKHIYLNVPFFVLRSVFYFSVWGWLAFRVPSRPAVAPVGLLAFVLTSTFASFDWMMSLNPHWGSSIYGVLFIVGNTLAALAFSVVMLNATRPTGEVEAQTSHDLGNLLLAFTMLWAYIELSQFLIIWYGNLPEEIPWYAVRAHGTWLLIAVFLVFAQFVMPFLLLLARRHKRNLTVLAAVAAWILAVRGVDLFWMIFPEFHATGVHLGLEDLVVPAALGGLWLTLFFDRYERRD